MYVTCALHKYIVQLNYSVGYKSGENRNSLLMFITYHDAEHYII